jgi:hypothetical protein
MDRPLDNIRPIRALRTIHHPKLLLPLRGATSPIHPPPRHPSAIMGGIYRLFRERQPT